MKKRKAVAESAEPREDAESDEEFRQELAGSMGDIVEGVKELAHPPRPPAVRFQPLDHPAGSHFGAPHLGAIAAKKAQPIFAGTHESSKKRTRRGKRRKAPALAGGARGRAADLSLRTLNVNNSVRQTPVDSHSRFGL